MIKRKTVESQIESAKETIEGFRSRMEKDPAHALHWGDGAFDATARLGVLTCVIGRMDELEKLHGDGADDEIQENILGYARRQVQDRATREEHSTGQCANLLERAILRSWAEVVELDSRGW